MDPSSLPRMPLDAAFMSLGAEENIFIEDLMELLGEESGADSSSIMPVNVMHPTQSTRTHVGEFLADVLQLQPEEASAGVSALFPAATESVVGPASQQEGGDTEEAPQWQQQQKQQKQTLPARRGRPLKTVGQYSKGYDAVLRYRQRKRDSVSAAPTTRLRSHLHLHHTAPHCTPLHQLGRC